MNRLLALLVLSFVVSLSASGAELRVFAASSLSDAMSEIGALYEKSTGDKVRFNFAASNVLARQITEGSPADVFFSADEARMNALERGRLLLPGSRRSLLSNTLVVIVPDDQNGGRTPRDLLAPSVRRIAIGHPEAVPVGVYAKEYLVRAGLWSGVQPKIVPCDSARAVLLAVEGANVGAGIVYRTDALLSSKVRIALEVKGKEAPAISYPAAVLRTARNAAAARRFLAFTSSPAARAIFLKYGFDLL